MPHAASARSTPPPDLTHIPLYLLTMRYAARRSDGRALERVTSDRLTSLGARMVFADELLALSKGVGRG